MRNPVARLVLVIALPLLCGCDRFAELLDIPNPAKEAALTEAEGQAIGSACRQSGRSIEDCYTLNPEAQKAAIFTGWKTMNDYMMEHNLKEVPSQLPPPSAKPATPNGPHPAASTQ
ncbi:MAG: hypothetical protein LBT71_02755 [Azoarcus sp.]|jgi:hypothetical protein|nr:hypothetical protein [Azoarcus sp.]